MEKSGIFGIADGTDSSSLYFLKKGHLIIFFLCEGTACSLEFHLKKENIKEILDHISSLEKLSNEDFESYKEEELVYRTCVINNSKMIVICKDLIDECILYLDFIGEIKGINVRPYIRPFDYARLKFWKIDNDRFNQFKNDLKEIYENWEE